MFTYYYDFKTGECNLEKILRTRVEEDILFTSRLWAKDNVSLKVYESNPKEYCGIVFGNCVEEVKKCDENLRIYKGILAIERK